MTQNVLYLKGGENKQKGARAALSCSICNPLIPSIMAGAEQEEEMKKWMLVVVVWIAAIALFGSIKVSASGPPEQKYQVPNVVGMTVEEGYQAYLDALSASGWLEHSGTNNVRYHVQPGNQDWQGTDLAKAVIIKQQPNARTSANWGTALCVWVAEVEPSPTPSPTPTTDPEPEPEPEPDDSEPTAPDTQESEGTLSYTL